MKYYYKKENLGAPKYGKRVELDHPAYRAGTMFEIANKGLTITQKRMELRYVFWDSIDYWLANDIFEHPKFMEYFQKNASEKPYPIIPLRSAMRALRMKPLPKQDWELYF